MAVKSTDYKSREKEKGSGGDLGLVLGSLDGMEGSDSSVGVWGGGRGGGGGGGGLTTHSRWAVRSRSKDPANNWSTLHKSREQEKKKKNFSKLKKP